MLSFFVAGQPQPGGSKKGLVRFAGGRPFAQVVEDNSTKNRYWRAAVSKAAMDAMAGRSPFVEPLRLDVVFHLKRPSGHYGKKGILPSAPAFPTVKPDATKLLRSTEDAMTGIVWRDDSLVVAQWVVKVYSETKLGAEISVWPAGVIRPPAKPKEGENWLPGFEDIKDLDRGLREKL